MAELTEIEMKALKEGTHNSIDQSDYEAGLLDSLKKRRFLYESMLFPGLFRTTDKGLEALETALSQPEASQPSAVDGMAGAADEFKVGDRIQIFNHNDDGTSDIVVTGTIHSISNNWYTVSCDDGYTIIVGRDELRPPTPSTATRQPETESEDVCETCEGRGEVVEPSKAWDNSLRLDYIPCPDCQPSQSAEGVEKRLQKEINAHAQTKQDLRDTGDRLQEMWKNAEVIRGNWREEVNALQQAIALKDDAFRQLEADNRRLQTALAELAESTYGTLQTIQDDVIEAQNGWEDIQYPYAPEWTNAYKIIADYVQDALDQLLKKYPSVGSHPIADTE